jgi:hypothetical protein
MADHILDKGYQATTAIRQFRAVIQTADDKVKECDGAAQLGVGFCQEEITAGDATLGRIAAIRVQGRTRAINGTAGALARNTRVATDNQGRVVAATTGQAVVGITVTAAAAQGDHIELDVIRGAVAP